MVLALYLKTWYDTMMMIRLEKYVGVSYVCFTAKWMFGAVTECAKFANKCDNVAAPILPYFRHFVKKCPGEMGKSFLHNSSLAHICADVIP